MDMGWIDRRYPRDCSVEDILSRRKKLSLQTLACGEGMITAMALMVFSAAVEALTQIIINKK